MTAEGQCAACSEALNYCVTCNSATECTSCSLEQFKVGESGTCVCDNTGKEDTMLLGEDGFCTCADGLFMDQNFGCLSCDNLVPGCKTCSITEDTDTLIPLDYIRMGGPDASPSWLSCDECTRSDRYVAASDGAQTSISCKHCITAFDGCSACGTHGDACTSCALTYFLQESGDCMRCDDATSGVSSNCLTCYDATNCATYKPFR